MLERVEQDFGVAQLAGASESAELNGAAPRAASALERAFQ
jgi:hypothetical protein